MTRDEARRAAMLSIAWENVDDWARCVDASDEPTGPGYTQCVFELAVNETGNDPYEGGSGADGESRIYIDMITARKLAPTVRALIEQELKALGIDTFQTEAGEK